MVHRHWHLWLLWLLVPAYAAVLAVRWMALPHNLVIHFSSAMAPTRFLARGWFAGISLALLAATVALVSYCAPRPGTARRGAATLGLGWSYGLAGFAAGVFWSLVRVNAGIGSAVRPAVALALGYAALGMVFGVSARAPLPARRTRVRSQRAG